MGLHEPFHTLQVMTIALPCPDSIMQVLGLIVVQGHACHTSGCVLR